MKNTQIYKDPVIRRFLMLISRSKKNGSPLSKIKEIYLFGSRCRDDWRPDSDYDILIILKQRDRGLKSRLYDIVMDILLDTGRLISLKIFTESEFNRLKLIPTPFIENVLKEGIRLGASD
jgi:predicted nucleotidyltransferase